MLANVPPLVLPPQLYCIVPLPTVATALILTVWPGQASVGLAFKLDITGWSFTVSMVFAVAVQPDVFVTVTV